jgi:hypothetical protein
MLILSLLFATSWSGFDFICVSSETNVLRKHLFSHIKHQLNDRPDSVALLLYLEQI